MKLEWAPYTSGAVNQLAVLRDKDCSWISMARVMRNQFDVSVMYVQLANQPGAGLVWKDKRYGPYSDLDTAKIAAEALVRLL